MTTASEARYNLFRYKPAPELYCAVPETRTIPRFVQAASWEFGGTVDGDAARLTGFEPPVASAAGRLNGFYLFQTVDRAAH